MSSRARSTKLPQDLAEAAELRSRRLGYSSWNAYIKGLIRYDLMVQGSHSVTLPIAHMRPDAQDTLDAELLAHTTTGTAVKGEWLERVIGRLAGSLSEEVRARLGHAAVSAPAAATASAAAPATAAAPQTR